MSSLAPSGPPPQPLWGSVRSSAIGNSATSRLARSAAARGLRVVLRGARQGFVVLRPGRSRPTPRGRGLPRSSASARRAGGGQPGGCGSQIAHRRARGGPGTRSRWRRSPLGRVLRRSSESSKSGCRRMVSASPIDDIRRSSIRRPGLTVRLSTSPSTGVAMSRMPTGMRAPGRSGTDPSMTRPRTRSGWSRAYQVAQIPPPDAPTSTADSSPSSSRISSTNCTAQRRKVPRGKLAGSLRPEPRSVDEVGPHLVVCWSSIRCDSDEVLLPCRWTTGGPSPASMTWTAPPDGLRMNGPGRRPRGPSARTAHVHRVGCVSTSARSVRWSPS